MSEDDVRIVMEVKSEEDCIYHIPSQIPHVSVEISMPTIVLDSTLPSELLIN